MPALIGVVMSALSRLFATQLGRWVIAAMLWLGLSWGTHEVAMGPLLTAIQTRFAAIPPEAMFWIGFFNFDKAITMMLSAYGVRASVAGAKVFLRRRATA